MGTLTGILLSGTLSFGTFRMPARVVRVEGPEVIVSVANGHEYAYYGDGEVGDRISVVFNDNGTLDDITDDLIVNIEEVER